MPANRSIYLTSELPDEQVDALGGLFLDTGHFDTLISGESVDVYKPDGSPLILFRAGVLPRAVCDAAYISLRAAAIAGDKRGGNRGLAAGLIRDQGDITDQRIGVVKGTRFKARKNDGTLSRTNRARIVRSGIAGYFDRNPRFPYCRLTAFNLDDNGARFAQAMPFIQAVDRVFAAEAPERYAAQLAIVQQTSSDFVIHGTAFTTITCNHNWQTAVHKDAGDYRPGFGVMSVMQAGHYNGCYLCWPKYRVAVDMRTSDVCLADVHEWHGNTPLTGAGRFERISCVFYYRARMVECGSAAEELERAKHYVPKEPYRLDY